MADADEVWLAVYRASLYAYEQPNGAGWRCFALDGAEASGVTTSVTLISAWNPQSEERSAEWNHAAHLRLAEDLRTAALHFTPAYGASLPDVRPAWREEGFALHGLRRAEALRWGRQCGQRALVWLDAGGAGLLFCASGVLHPCGLRALPTPASAPAAP